MPTMASKMRKSKEKLQTSPALRRIYFAKTPEKFAKFKFNVSIYRILYVYSTPHSYFIFTHAKSNHNFPCARIINLHKIVNEPLDRIIT